MRGQQPGAWAGPLTSYCLRTSILATVRNGCIEEPVLALGMVASDLSLLLCRTFVELAWSVPFDTLIALTRDDAPRTGARSRGRNSWSQASAPQPARRALYAAQLRRAAPVVRLFATAPPGGEREAAYHALVRLVAAANASLGASPRGGAPITPGALYRDLTQGAHWRMPGAGALAFDARTCAELDRRDAVRL